MLRRTWLAVAVMSVALMASAAPALAFDGGPHAELINDSMAGEGFEKGAVQLAQVNSWFNDLYEQAELNPFSGHGGFFKRFLSLAFTSEDWPDGVIDAAFRVHFDNYLAGNTRALSGEWDRLRRAVWTLAREARDRNDPGMLLAVLGMSLHEVQDFYAHSNWVEPLSGHGLPGADGPGWREQGFGSNPTWFDVPADVREKANIYSDESPGHRQHGFWDSDGNTSVKTSMNKDWPGRPYYLDAAITSYFASRQWVEAVRSWVGDDAFWARAQQFRGNSDELEHDLNGMVTISLSSGHWQGQGEPFGTDHPGPGGSLLGLREAAANYFQKGDFPARLHGRTQYRLRFTSLIRRLADPHPTGLLGPVPSSQDLQRSLRIVVLRVLSMKGEGLGDPGPDDADMYADVGIDGQQMTSAVISGRDKYNFPDPNEPFTWIKAVPAVPDQGEPVESIEVDVRTANDRSAGTDDDVFLRLAGGLRLPLDKRLYDDFERNSVDTYSVPIDDAVKKGLVVGAINRVSLQKSPDGLGGGWKLNGITLRVNGIQLYNDQGIGRWLQDDNRTWTAPDFVPSDPRSTKIPVWIHLGEEDVIYGVSDEGDINPLNKRRLVSIGYTPGEPVQLTTKGGDRFGGRIGDGDRASITYRLDTITPEPIPAVTVPPPSAPPVGPKPDLVITKFTYAGITITNQSDGAAGDFRVRISDGPFSETKLVTGLGPNASISIPDALTCTGNWIAVVDDLNQVDESNEDNNSEEPEAVFC